MKRKHFLSLLIFSIFTINCKKEEPLVECAPEPTNINSDFELIWSKSGNRRYLDVNHVTVASSSVIYNHNPSGSVQDEELIAFDKATGDTLWQYKSGFWYQAPQVYQDKYFVNIDGELVCIDAANGNEVWRLNKGYLSHFTIENGNIYAAFGNVRGVSDSTEFFKINPSTGNEIKMYSIHKSERNNFSQNPKGMKVWIHPNGNEVLFVHSVSYYSSSLNVISKSEYYALDLTADSMYWDLGYYFVSNEVSNPVIENYNLYLHSSLGEIAKINLLAKTEIWRNLTLPYSHSTRMILNNNLLYKSIGSVSEVRVHSVNDGSIYKKLGNLSTFSTEQPHATSNFKKYNNKIYFSNYNTVCVVDLLSNEVLRIINQTEKLGPLSSGGFAKSLDLDPRTNYIYTEREGSIICMKEL
ncbi:MAG: PQQ-binding-like beta-propeller repeat protein [Flavobacteriales bacterium]